MFNFKFFNKDNSTDALASILNTTTLSDDPHVNYKELVNMSERFFTKLKSNIEATLFYNSGNFALIKRKDESTIFLVTFNEPVKFKVDNMQNYHLVAEKGSLPLSLTYIDSDHFPVHLVDKREKRTVALKVRCCVHEFRYKQTGESESKQITFKDYFSFGGELYSKLRSHEHDYYCLCNFSEVGDSRRVNRELSKEIIHLSRNIIRKDIG